MRKGLFVAFIALLVVAANILSACAGTPAAAPPTAAPPTAAPTAQQLGVRSTPAPAASGAATEVHFYTINPITGQSAAYGTKAVNDQQLLTDYINSQGGFTDNAGNRYTIKLTVWDMANSREQSIAGYREAASDPSVVAVLGPTADVGNLPIIPVAGQLKVPYIIASSGATITDWNPYTFRVNADSGTLVPKMMKVLQDKVGMTNIAQIYDQTQDAQKFEADTIKKYADQAGIKVVDSEAFRAGDVDFTQQLTKIKSANPDWVMIDAATPEAAKIVNQMAQLGINAKTYVSFGTPLDPVMWDLTQGKVANVYTLSPGITGPGVQYNDPMAITLYQQKYGELPTIWAVFGWDAEAAAIDAIKRAGTGTDREKVRDALGNTVDFPAAEGGFINWKNPPMGDNLTPGIAVVKVTGKDTWQLVQ